MQSHLNNAHLFIFKMMFCITGVNPSEVSLSGINTVAMWILEHPVQDSSSSEDQSKPQYRSEIRIRMDSPVEETSSDNARERRFVWILKNTNFPFPSLF